MPHRASPWLPKSVLAFRHYTPQTFRHDVIAGVTVGLVALPLAMAFAIASGLSPQAGIYCAIVTGFIISALGGSRTQIGGPTGAFVVVVANIIANYGVSGLFMCTMMAGVMLILLGVTGMGSAVKFIPRPVVVGFTNGIAILIASTQIRDFLGLGQFENTGEFLGRMASVAAHWQTASGAAIGLALASLAVIIVVNKWGRGVPGTIVALIAGTAGVWVFGLDVETINSRFGGVPAGLPTFALPEFKAELVLKLLSPAVTVAMLGAMESLMSAVVADRMSGDRHNPNVELIAQGIANVASPLFGGLPATGAIARTATNIRSGARTPVAGIVHAITLLIILLSGASLAGHIPIPVLAAILLTVAYRMGEWSEIGAILRQTRADIAVWIATFSLTVLADLTVAVEVGMVLAALLFIRRVATTTTVARVTNEGLIEARAHALHDKRIPDYVAMYRIHGPFLFGATDKIQRVIDDLPKLPPIVILRMRNMTALDGTGLRALEDLAERTRASGRTAIFCGAREQPRAMMHQAGFSNHVGAENICPHAEAALVRAADVFSARAASGEPG